MAFENELIPFVQASFHAIKKCPAIQVLYWDWEKVRGMIFDCFFSFIQSFREFQLSNQEKRVIFVIAEHSIFKRHHKKIT